MRLLKPHATIYGQAADRADFEPSHCFFTDGSLNNGGGTIVPGMATAPFESAPQITADLVRRGLTIDN